MLLVAAWCPDLGFNGADLHIERELTAFNNPSKNRLVIIIERFDHIVWQVIVDGSGHEPFDPFDLFTLFPDNDKMLGAACKLRFIYAIFSSQFNGKV